VRYELGFEIPEDDIPHVRFEVFTAVTMKNGVFWVVLTRATRRNNPEDTILDIPHSHLRENLKSCTALTGWAVSPVRYELGFDIPEADIPHSHRRVNLKSCTALTGWAVSPVRYELDFDIPEDGIRHSHRRENLKSCKMF
jgi:hypothetical protein